MGGATRDGTAEPTSQEQDTRQEWGQRMGGNRKSHREAEISARKRRGRAKRRLRQSTTRNRARARGREITVSTHNVRTMAVDGTHGIGQALDVLSVYDRLGCDVIGLQETRPGCSAARTGRERKKVDRLRTERHPGVWPKGRLKRDGVKG